VRIVFSAEAETDLERIGDYIAADNPLRALSFVKEPIARCERLSDMPRAYPLVPRYEHTDVRRLPHGNYLIFYRADENQVVILHVLNGAQDYEALLFPGDET
jgi:plasmid stabilization system protein ParE